MPAIQQSISYFQCPHKILSAGRREIIMSVPLPLQGPTDFSANSMKKKSQTNIKHPGPTLAALKDSFSQD